MEDIFQLNQRFIVVYIALYYSSSILIVISLKYLFKKKKREDIEGQREREMNHTMITDFVLDLSDDPDLQIAIFLLLFITYILSVTGNLTIIILNLLHPILQTPMYFFLRTLSFFGNITYKVCIPRFLGAVITREKTIYYNNCRAQLFFFIFMG